MRVCSSRGRSNYEWIIRWKFLFVTRFIFSIERPCPKSRFLARDAAMSSVSPLGCVGVPFLASEVDEL